MAVVRARVPEKQGLKHDCLGRVLDLAEVRARVPEKQGLKPRNGPRIRPGGDVRARVPEKQGLKHYVFFCDTKRREVSGREFQKNKD